MAKRRRVWVVIADGEHARIVEPAAAGSFRTLASIDAMEAHRRTQALGTDKPGRSFESTGASRHAIAPKHDLHELAKQSFEHFVAARLNEASEAGSFERLVLVAPPKALPEIRAALDQPTAAKLVGTLTKDLVKIPDHDLGPHLAEWAMPATRLDQ